MFQSDDYRMGYRKAIEYLGETFYDVNEELKVRKMRMNYKGFMKIILSD